MSDLDKNLTTLHGHLSHFADTGILNQINGQPLPAQSGDWFDTHSPVDETHIARVARSGAAGRAAGGGVAADADGGGAGGVIGRVHAWSSQ